MYVVLVAPPGKARKGTAMGPGLDFLDDLGVKLAAEATTREALIRELRNCNDTIIFPNGKTEFHASLTIYSEEFTVFLGYQNWQLINDLTDWYDCRKRWTYQTKHMGTDDIIGVWVNILGATTPDMIQTSMPIETIGGGLASRMIFVYESRREKVVPIPFLTEEEIQLRELLMKDLEQIHILQGEFKVTTSFVESWVDWYTSSEASLSLEDNRLSGYVVRRPTHILKLSMILNASRGNEMLLEDRDFTRAVEILKRTEVKMPLTFGGVGKAKLSDILHNVMVEIAMQKKCTFQHLIGRFYRDVSHIELKNILSTLETMKFFFWVYEDNQQKLQYNEKTDTAKLFQS
jgi:predicted DNA-binding ribbon-helix-helix protein